MLAKLFSDNGDISMMRVMAFIALIMGGAIAIAGLYLGKDMSGLSILCGVFVTSAFGGKVAQKAFESKGDSK